MLSLTYINTALPIGRGVFLRLLADLLLSIRCSRLDDTVRKSSIGYRAFDLARAALWPGYAGDGRKLRLRGT